MVIMDGEDRGWVGVCFCLSKLPFWSLRFGNLCHFSLKLKPFASGSPWFQLYCHFDPKVVRSYFSYQILLFYPFP
ncbi:hypothetical protein Hanom_Chr03g00200891 [Helianthus anomalus]